MGTLLDESGIDWWDILSLEIASDLQQIVLLHRLARDLPPDCELYASRPFALATALQRLCGGRMTSLESRAGSVFRSLRHYSEAFSKLDTAQVVQVVQDKFDAKHSLRRRLATRKQSSSDPVVLLPSAYIGVSRVAVSYAAMLPELQFLLVNARASSELQTLPGNVRMVSLDSYFGSADDSEIKQLLGKWRALQERLVLAAVEFESADAAGLLGRMPNLIRWAMAIRTAWSRVFELENIAGCLSADDSNPYSRIPLLLAKMKDVPALACHHGSLDAWMAVKSRHADFYLVKGEMERDYLVRTCRVAPQQIILGAPAISNISPIEVTDARADRPWLVFFTEAYAAAAWRSDEVYRELLPELRGLAQQSGLELVFKLHPFESVEGHRRLLRRLLPKAEAEGVRIIAGPASEELWRKTQFALTGQSTVAMDCAIRGVPVFLCAWLRDSLTGYVQQYTRFGIGQVLESAAQIVDIPRFLESQSTPRAVKNKLRQTMYH
jgi:hypothetical protein